MQIINKITFCKVINLLKEQNKSDKENSRLLASVFGIVGMMDGYCNDNLIEAVFVMLHDSFPKKDDFCPIEYWCFELGFKPRQATKNFPKINSAAELYDYLTT